MPPAVSVIIPTYNRWPLLKEAVDSVLTQSYDDYELIVVDDGSTDGTVQELIPYCEHLRVLVQPRHGVAAARNAGAQVATGKYLAFLDSDDLWLPEKLRIQVRFMEEGRGIQICQTEEIWIRNGVRLNPKARHQKPSGNIFKRSLELCLVSPSAVMMTRDLFDEAGGFDESFPVCEDYDLWLRIAVNHPVPLIAKPLTVKRAGHIGQLSRSQWGMDRFRVLALAKLLRGVLQGEKRRWVADELGRKVAILAAGARKRGKEDEALSYERFLEQCLEEYAGAGPSDSTVC